ncbi:hypothetical protein [Nocardioides caricicola]|uniref:Translation initiation factor IF-2 n=1 Tax=Nocardioides caricicola TaxID=634770 RepID=A0ABW0N2E4_9ACTN
MHLRTPTPTLEPDDAFVARLSALAAAGAPVATAPRSPITTWRVALAAAGVAAILVGVAWLAGLSPTGSPQPAPGPATSPSAPESSASTERAPSSAEPGAGTSRAVDPSGTTFSETAAVDPPAAQPTGTPGRQPTNLASGADSDPGQSGQSGQAGTAGPGRGPNAHAGDHPNEHATTKSNNGKPRNEDKPDRGPKKPKDPTSPGSNAHR